MVCKPTKNLFSESFSNINQYIIVAAIFINIINQERCVTPVKAERVKKNILKFRKQDIFCRLFLPSFYPYEECIKIPKFQKKTKLCTKLN